jgi:hypothetical protein
VEELCVEELCVEELCCGRIVHGRIVCGRIVRGRIVALPLSTRFNLNQEVRVVSLDAALSKA